MHASLFADYLQQAEHLLEENYLQASVVIAGGTLEEHLRQLSQQAGNPLTYLDNKGKTKKKMASRLNDELTKQGVYSKIEHSHADGWIKLRNEAAHRRLGRINLCF